MTPEQHTKYLASPNHCPVCGSRHFDSTDSTHEDIYHWYDLRCNDCNAEWTETYLLNDVYLKEKEN